MQLRSLLGQRHRSLSGFEDKTLFLGLGPAKTGSTWLYEYLRRHPEFCTSALKELHFFSAKYHARTPELFDRRIVRRIRELSSDARLENSLEAQDQLFHLAARLRMTKRPERYLQSFRNNLTSRHRAFGEISPSYSGLTREGFAHIHDIHPRVKLFICLRDPLSRMDSAIRHMALRGKAVSYDEFLSGDVRRKLEFHNMYYGRILDTIFDVFDPTDVHIQFFEELFDQDAVDKITDFIGIARCAASFGERFAHAPPAAEMQPEHRERLLELLAPIYAECRRRFGDRIPDSWEL